jgi:hypothetical protein
VVIEAVRFDPQELTVKVGGRGRPGIAAFDVVSYIINGYPHHIRRKDAREGG